MSQETIEVQAIGPYGVRVGTEWYKFGRGIDKAAFAKGSSYTVLITPGQKGGKYISKIVLGSTGSPNAGVALDPAINASTPPVNTNADLTKLVAASGAPMKYGKPLSAFEVEEGKKIQRSGVIQAAAQCPTLNQIVTDGNPETLKNAIKDLAEFMLTWVNEKGDSNGAV